MKLGLLKEVKNLRTIWPHEANDFTPWLADEENISILSDTLGLDLEVQETESDVGNFHLDIYAVESGTGKKVIIENQLEDTNHDHLGKIITYASGKDADYIVWIVKHARDEHKAAIEWLNNHTDDSVGFFLCEIKLYIIGDSNPAVKFDIIEKPNDWTKEIKKTSRQNNANEELRLEYWQEYCNYVNSDRNYMSRFKIAKPSIYHWLDHYVGTSVYHFNTYVITSRNEICAEIYINDNKEFYHQLHSKKEAIENSFGHALDWKEMPDRKASRILIVNNKVNINKKSDWSNQFAWLKDNINKLYDAIAPYV